MTDYRVWYVINPPAKPTYIYVKDPQTALALIKNEIARQLKDNTIFANAFGLEVFEDGAWSEWYDDNGFDIMELANEH
jgi:hypothetical protein